MAKRGRTPKILPEDRPGWSRRLISARIARQLSQAGLAAIVNLSQSTIGEYETGKNEPDLLTFRRLAAALRVSPQWILFGDRIGYSDSNDAFDHQTIDEIPDEIYSDEQFADVMVATKEILVAEKMPSDDRTVISLSRQLLREIEIQMTDGRNFEECLQSVIRERQAALAAAKRLAFNTGRY